MCGVFGFIAAAGKKLNMERTDRITSPRRICWITDSSCCFLEDSSIRFTDRKFDSKRPGVRGFGGEGFASARYLTNPATTVSRSPSR